MFNLFTNGKIQILKHIPLPRKSIRLNNIAMFRIVDNNSFFLYVISVLFFFIINMDVLLCVQIQPHKKYMVASNNNYRQIPDLPNPLFNAVNLIKQ